jgi:hypothetical protein
MHLIAFVSYAKHFSNLKIAEGKEPVGQVVGAHFNIWRDAATYSNLIVESLVVTSTDQGTLSVIQSSIEVFWIAENEPIVKDTRIYTQERL